MHAYQSSIPGKRKLTSLNDLVDSLLGNRGLIPILVYQINSPSGIGTYFMNN